MSRNLAELRERIRDAQSELDRQRESNRALAANDAATAQEINAAMEATNRMAARLNIMRDDLAAEEAHQREALRGAEAPAAASDRRGAMLRSNEYARAFAYAIANGISRKKGKSDERCKILYDALTEGGGSPVGTDGGFLVPEDIDHSIREQMRTLDPLAGYFGQETVTAPTGWRVMDTAPTKGFVATDEMGNIDDDDDQPAFVKVPYTTSKKALILPVSNELAMDNVANLFAYISRWFARKLVITENAMIITALRTLTATDITSDPLAGIKTALNKTLDPAISRMANILTNQSGFDAFDQLKDEMQRPLLQPMPTDETAYRIKGRNVVMASDATMANVSGAADVFVGAGSQFATIFTVGGFELASTDIGGSAWRTDSTELRGIVRNGIATFDSDAMARLSITL